MKIKIKLLDSLEHTVARCRLEWMIYWSDIRAEVIGLKLKTLPRLKTKMVITRLDLLSQVSKNCWMSGRAIIRSAVHLKKL